MAKTGRPKIVLDWEEIGKLCFMQATQEEISWWFGCSVDTLERACKREQGISFADYCEQKKGKGKISLKRSLFQQARKGNTAALIFALKNYCGLVDAYQTKNDTSLKQDLTFKIGFDDEPDPNADT